jgi:multidrug/hemolysin transport system permease protein
MTELKALIVRNNKLFIKDKGVFLTSLITPMILLILYVSFLGNVYRDTFVSVLDMFGLTANETTLSGLVAGQLTSSLLSVCCVTVAFCSNMVMVSDKISGARDDIMLTPVKRPVVALSYFISCYLSTLMVCLCGLALCLGYMAVVGWFLTAADLVLIILDVMLLTMFGVSLSSVVNYFLSSQGHISAVGSMVSSTYGFISGAYMPLSQFSEGLQKALSFFPGTYGTVLLRYHTTRGALEKMASEGIPDAVVEDFRASIDASIKFFGNSVPNGIMYAIIGTTVLVLVGVYVLLNRKKK